MKNDFDFIKNKIEESGVKAPESMDGDFVMKQLENVQPAAEITELKPKKRRTGLAAGLAAAFVAVVALSVFAVMHFSKPAVRPAAVVSANVPLKTFTSYDELKAQLPQQTGAFRYFTDEITAGNIEYDAEESSSGSSGASSSDGSFLTGGMGSSDSYSETYKQVEGVDEGDIVKTDGKYLYLLSTNARNVLTVYTATDQPELVATVYPASKEDPAATPDESDNYFDTDTLYATEMYLYGDRLVLVGIDLDGGNSVTDALVYDISDIKNIKLADSFCQSGYYKSSRMIGDTLYLISEEWLYSDDFEIPVCYSGTDKQEIPIECVYAMEHSAMEEMLIVGGYTLSDSSSDVQSTVILHAAGDIYCNKDNLYICATEWNYPRYYLMDLMMEEITGGYTGTYEPNKTQIYKVSLTDGISFTAYGEVEGILDSRYSLDEKDGYLRVAATTEDKDYVLTNCLYILDKDLNEVGSVTGFAKDESIKAVRYVGDVAYVITYEQTDPLFIIDVSNPAAPEILGEVKIDGFSTMLVPVDDNTILGLGFDTEEVSGYDMQEQSGFKLALFDVSDKLNPKVIDEKVYKDCYSPVMYEPRALVYNPDRDDYIVPLNADYTDYGNDASGDFDIRGGMLNFKVEDGKIKELAREEMRSDLNDAYYDFVRCAYAGENIYLIVENYEDGMKLYTTKYR